MENNKNQEQSNMMKLGDFLRCFEQDTYVEIFAGSNATSDILFSGLISGIVSQKMYLDQWMDFGIEPEFVNIDPPGAVVIIVDLDISEVQY